MTGKNERAYSTATGSRIASSGVPAATAARIRDLAKNKRSRAQMTPAKAPTHPGARTRGRGDAPPPRCGWDQGTLVVQSGEPEEDHPPYEQRFSLASDGQRLVEVILFKGGRSDGFSASRVWNRATPAPATSSSSSQK